MAESGALSIGEYTKLQLFEELKEYTSIHSRLETEYKKLARLSQIRNSSEGKYTFSTEKLEDIINEGKKVLDEVNYQYQQLYELNGCDKPSSEDNGSGNKAGAFKPSDCDCVKVETIRDNLLRLLQSNFDLCGSLKEQVEVLKITTKYYPQQSVIPSGGEIVEPATICDLVTDIGTEMDEILRFCKLLWKDHNRESAFLRDSGIYTGKLQDSMDSLAISSHGSEDGASWKGGNRNRSASENTEDQIDDDDDDDDDDVYEETDVKTL